MKILSVLLVLVLLFSIQLSAAEIKLIDQWPIDWTQKLGLKSYTYILEITVKEGDSLQSIAEQIKIAFNTSCSDTMLYLQNQKTIDGTFQVRAEQKFQFRFCQLPEKMK